MTRVISIDLDNPDVDALEAIWHELERADRARRIDNRPTIGAFPRATIGDPPDLDAWLREDPRRLGGVVTEMRRFSRDVPWIVQAALKLADDLGIDAEIADQIVTAALREKAASCAG